MEITLFDGARSVASQNMQMTWAELCEVIPDFMSVGVNRNDKLSHSAMIFGRCEGRRANANVRFLSGLAADFDLAPADPRYIAFDTMCDRLDSAGFAYIAYTTTKNCEAHNKFRLLMPYARDVPLSGCQAAWQACNDKLGDAIDMSTKDPARLSFLPAAWAGNPFNDPTHGLVTLTRPFDAVRVSVAGQPILSAADIDGLTDTDTHTDTQRPRDAQRSAEAKAEWLELIEAERTQDSVEAWLRQVDPAEAFSGTDDFKTSDLYGRYGDGYRDWCKDSGHSPMAVNKFGRGLKRYSGAAWNPLLPPRELAKGTFHCFKPIEPVKSADTGEVVSFPQRGDIASLKAELRNQLGNKRG